MGLGLMHGQEQCGQAKADVRQFGLSQQHKWANFLPHQSPNHPHIRNAGQVMIFDYDLATSDPTLSVYVEQRNSRSS